MNQDFKHAHEFCVFGMTCISKTDFLILFAVDIRVPTYSKRKTVEQARPRRTPKEVDTRRHSIHTHTCLLTPSVLVCLIQSLLLVALGTRAEFEALTPYYWRIQSFRFDQRMNISATFFRTHSRRKLYGTEQQILVSTSCSDSA